MGLRDFSYKNPMQALRHRHVFFSHTFNQQPGWEQSIARFVRGTVCCLLSAVCCLPSAVRCLVLSAVCCLLSAVCCLLSDAVCCLLSAGSSPSHAS
jgi:hypothetical protein